MKNYLFKKAKSFDIDGVEVLVPFVTIVGVIPLSLEKDTTNVQVIIMLIFALNVLNICVNMQLAIKEIEVTTIE